MTTPAAIEPDTKDWTWVLERICPECGYDARSVDRRDVGRLLRDSASGWPDRLARPEVVTRREPAVWSPLEYACHVRDVHRVFRGRLALMLEQDRPSFPNWDQDETAVAERYDLQDPRVVAQELVEAADAVAASYDTVREEAWQRAGVRSDGSVFTIETLARYHLHDAVHHVWDVAR